MTIQARETDGLEVSGFDFGGPFSKGLLVAMSDDKTFHYYGLDQLELETVPKPEGMESSDAGR